MKKGVLVIIILISTFVCNAQGRADRQTRQIDTCYIESFYKDLIVRIYTADKGNHFFLRDRENDLSLKYRSNDLFKLGLGVNYKWFGLKIGADIPFSKNSTEHFGEASSFGLQSYLIASKFVIDIVARRTSGYYLSLGGKNSSDFESDSYGVYRLISKLKTSNLGVNFIYVLNSDRFSYKAAFNQTDLQKKSAGSVLFGGGMSSFGIEDDGKIVPEEIGSIYFEGWENLLGFRAKSIYGSTGYAYSLVPFKRAIITASASLEFGIRRNQLEFLNQSDHKNTKLISGGEMRVSGGYHFPWFYFGASYVQSQINSDIRFNTLQITNGTSFLEFTLSKRIKL